MRQERPSLKKILLRTLGIGAVAAATTAVAGNIDAAASKPVRQELETAPISGPIVDLKQRGAGLIGVMTNSADGASYLITVDSGQTFARAKLPFKANSAGGSPTNPNIMLSVGNNTVWITKDNTETNQVITTTLGQNLSAQVSPDNNFAFVTSDNNFSSGTLAVEKIDLSNNAVSNIVVTGNYDVGGITDLNQLTTDSQGNYVGDGLVSGRVGYYRFTFNPTGMQVDRLNNLEGFARGDLTEFSDSQGRKRIWIVNNDSNGTPSLGKIEDNANDVLLQEIKPDQSRYTITSAVRAIGIGATAADVATNKGAMGTITQNYDAQGNLTQISFLETFPLDAATDYSKRNVITMPAGVVNKLFINGGYYFAGMDKGLYRLAIGSTTWEEVKAPAGNPLPQPGKYRNFLPSDPRNTTNL